MPQAFRNTGEMLSGGYRYSFQGQEADDEIKGAGNSINYTYRIHDPRVGRFFAVDPLAATYSYNSPYSFSENRLIDCIELEGLEKLHYTCNIPGLGLSGSGTIDLGLPEHAGIKARVESEMNMKLTQTDVVTFDGTRQTVTSTAYINTMSLTVNNSQNKTIQNSVSSEPVSSFDASLSVGVQVGLNGKIAGTGSGVDVNAASMEICSFSAEQTISSEGPVETNFEHCFDGTTTVSHGISGSCGPASGSVEVEYGAYTEGGTIPNSTTTSCAWNIGPQPFGVGADVTYSDSQQGWTSSSTETSFAGVGVSFSVSFIIGIDLNAQTGVRTTTTTTTSTNYTPSTGTP